MKILTLKPTSGHDLYGKLVCEHCAEVADLSGGHSDGHWHDRVLPAFHCGACGLNRAGEEKSPEVTARNQANGVNGV
jgi:hypothetical protein